MYTLNCNVRCSRLCKENIIRNARLQFRFISSPTWVKNFCANSAHEKETKRTIGMGWCTLGIHGDIMRSNLPLFFKRKVCNHCVLPLLTYSSETWHLTKEQERKLRIAHKEMGKKCLESHGELRREHH